MASITFTEQQQTTLTALTSSGSANYFAGYDYLKQELLALTSADIAEMQVTQQQVNDCVFWLTRASAINQNLFSDQANNFIRDVTRYGLLWDGNPVGQIQSNSDAIGEAVISEILLNGAFPPSKPSLARTS